MRNSLMLKVFTIAAIMLIGIESAGAVDKTFKKADRQVYFGGGLTYNSIGGDFADQGGLFSTYEAILVPEINSGFGFGLTAGFSGKMSPKFDFAIEASFSMSSHDYDFDLLDLQDDATAMFFDFNFKGIYSPQMIQPYLLLGISAPYIKVKDAASSSTRVEDARFTGIGVNLGGGMDLYISPVVFLDVNLMYRVEHISNVEGVGDKMEIPGGLDAGTLSISASLMYAIPLK